MVSKSQVINESVNYLNYSIKDGLPSAETYDIFQDSKGFIWIGTDNGLVKYDGATFKVYTTQDGLTDNTIFKIYEDYKGRIWFATYNRKLCYYQNDEFVPYTYNDVLEKVFLNKGYSNTITNIKVTETDSLKLELVWLLTQPEPFLELDSLGNYNQYHDSHFDSSLIQIMFETNQLQLFKNLSVLFSKKGNGFNRLVHSYHFGRLRISLWNNLTIFSTPQGIYWYSPETNSILRHVLPEYYTTDFIFDFEGGLWCSTLSHGLFYIPTPQIQQFKLKQMQGVRINGILQTNEQLIFHFNMEHGNYTFQNQERQLQKFHSPISTSWLLESDLKEGIKFENQIYFLETQYHANSIVRFNDSSLLTSSSSTGLLLLSNKDNTLQTPAKRKYTFLDKYNYDWFYIDVDTTHKHHNKLAREYAPNQYYQMETLSKEFLNTNRLFRYSEDQILLSTLKGLYALDVRSRIITKSKILGADNTIRIQDIIRTADSTLLFATKGNGILGIKNEQKFQIKIKENDKLNVVNQLIYDSLRNIVFAATNHGVYLLEQTDTTWKHQHVVSTYDGLELPDIRQIRIENDHLYYANSMGIGKVALSQLKSSKKAPYLYIEQFSSIDPVHYPEKTDIEIPYDSNSFDINFQAIGYKSRNNFIYSYRLDSDEIWRTTNNSSITFNALDPGTYTLEIKAKNIQGVESEIEQISFTIATPYWQSWWFISILFILFIALIVFIIFRVISFYKNKTAIQRKMNELQVLSLQSKMSPHFIFNSLNSIQNYILTNNKIEANEYLIDFSRLIRTILKNSENSSIQLSKELEILSMYVDLEKKRLRKPFKFNVEIIGTVDLTNCEIPSLLVQPYVENSIWHGQVYNNPKGEIKIRIERKENTLYFEISDNGIGIKKAQSFKQELRPEHKSIGTEVTKNRIELVAELHQQMSEVTVGESFSMGDDNGFIGTVIKFNIPYILSQNT